VKLMLGEKKSKGDYKTVPAIIYIHVYTRGSREPVIAHLVFNLTSKS
jgi:hypothetical protein